MAGTTYSFLNFNLTILGPGGAVNLASGAAAAEEGVTFEPVEDKNVMTIGADGKGQHSLIASNAFTATVRLLKTSPTNQLLMLMYNLQSANAALWGLNTLTGGDSGRGDFVSMQGVAFGKLPALNYAKEAGMNEWTFQCLTGTIILG